MATFGAPQLLHALLLATSTADALLLHRTNEQLDEWESTPAYWDALVDFAFDREHLLRLADGTVTTESARQLAAIRLKNGIARFWRTRVVRRVSVAIPADTKARVRSKLLGVLTEPDRTVALQVATTIARIARLDFPGDWPDLLTVLQDTVLRSVGALSSGSTDWRDILTLTRASETLHQVLKELESVRMLAGKMRMSEVSAAALPVLQPAYEQLFRVVVSVPEDSDALSAWVAAPGRVELIRAAHLLLKVLRRYAVADMGLITARAVEHTAHGQPTNLAFHFFASTPPQLEHLMQVRTRLSYADRRTTTAFALAKLQTAYAKVHLSLVQRIHSNAARWPGWDQVVWWYWQTLRDAAGNPESCNLERPDVEDMDIAVFTVAYPYRWVVCALAIMRATLRKWHRNRPVDSIFAGASGAQFELEATDTLLRVYLRLTRADLERWYDNPEEYALDMERADADNDILPAAEDLMAVLSANSLRKSAEGTNPRTAPTVAEYVWNEFERAADYPVDELDSVLRRAAVYSAVARCRDQLDPLFGFAPGSDDNGESSRLAAIVKTRLVPEASLDLAGAGPAWVIMRCRIAYLLWDWCEYIQTDDRTAVYALLVDLLRYVPEKTDTAVQLQAARSLMALADTVQFDADGFVPYLGAALERLMELITDASLSDIGSVRTIASALSVITERVGPRVVPYAPHLVRAIPEVWLYEDPEARARPSVLEFFGKLARVLGPTLRDRESADLVQLHRVAAMLVHAGLQPAAVSLYGSDALLLWARVLQSTLYMTDSLFGLLAYLPALLLQPDFAPLACRIVEESVLLEPLAVLEVRHAARTH